MLKKRNDALVIHTVGGRGAARIFIFLEAGRVFCMFVRDFLCVRVYVLLRTKFKNFRCAVEPPKPPSGYFSGSGIQFVHVVL